MCLLRLIDKNIGWLWSSLLILVPIQCFLMDCYPKFRKNLSLMGEISLESYLLNICLGNLIPEFSKDSYVVSRYCMIIFIGITLSVLINRKVVRPVMKKLIL